MNCLKIQENMSLYYDGELKPDVKDAFSKHLSECEECRNDYQYFKTALVALKGLEPIEAPQDILINIEERIDNLERKKSFVKNFFNSPFIRMAPQLVTVFLIIVAAGVGYYTYTSVNKTPRSMPQTQISDKQVNPQNRVASLDPNSLQSDKMKSMEAVKQDSKMISRQPVKRRAKVREAPVAMSVAAKSTEENVEIVPCNDNPKDMNQKIEKMLLLSNGQIVRVSAPQATNKEILVRVPGRSYNAFMERLKEAMAEANAEKVKEQNNDIFRGASLKTVPMDDTSQKMLSEPHESEELEMEDEPSAVETPIPEVKLIKVIYR